MIKWLRNCIILGTMVFFSACTVLEQPWNIFFNSSKITETVEIGIQSETPSDNDEIPVKTITPSPDFLHDACDFAQAGVPFDISIPDGTKFKPGDSFTKTWRLVNAGTCVWTSEYAIVWFFGDDIGVSRVKHLREDVLPGESIDLSVDMFAPDKPGIYHSFWKLRNPDGQMFGIGPQGDSAFWVEFEVINTTTPTVNSLPTSTATTVVMSSGETILNVDESLNLDDMEVDDANDNDLNLVEDDEGNLQINALNGAKLSLFSTRVPNFADCQVSSFDTDVVYLHEISDNVYFCYLTSQGLPGYVKINSIDLDNKFVQLVYLNWKIP